MANPYKLWEDLKSSEVNRLINAVEDQLYLLIYQPKFFITSVELIGTYFVISFKLEEFKESDMALTWRDTIPKADYLDFIKFKYSPEDPESYALNNMLTVAYDWLTIQEIE